MTYIKRSDFGIIEKSLTRFKVVAIVGPRQVGKSTLAKKMLTDQDISLDLERPSGIWASSLFKTSLMAANFAP